MDMKYWQDCMHELMALNNRLSGINEDYEALLKKLEAPPEIAEAAQQTGEVIGELRENIKKTHTKIDKILNNRSDKDD